MTVDYEKVGLKVGLEIHQQLNTPTKMFCHCKPGLFKEEPEVTFLRRLRPTQSELGQVDPAAFFEFQKGTRVHYEANLDTSCLVEMDEEPPHALSPEAVEVSLTVALMIGAKPVDEIHVMRKTVIDGSNTTGFQRTCAVALGGEIQIGEKTIPIEHVSLEEDAARKTGQEGKNITRYRIDRLGIPLIEVATAPAINSPKEAEEAALAIGRIYRATGRAMRGLGTIRQDLNISIPNGALVEIKGVQELELISLVVEYEVQRQLNLIEMRDELRKKVKEGSLKDEIFDVTDVFSRTECKILRKALDNKQKIAAVKLPKFGGFLKRELAPNLRLGTEMADRARFWGRVDGIFHTDEMPAYRITMDEVEALRKVVKAEEDDAVVFVADEPENVDDALRAVVERARETLKCVPEETRAPTPDGVSRYMRPRPGSARMYPETDIPPVRVSEDLITRAGARSVELPERRLRRLMEDHKLNEKMAKQIMDSEYEELFEVIAKESTVSPTTVAAFLTETLKALKRDGVNIGVVSEDQLKQIFRSIGSGELTKEALPELVSWLCAHENASLAEAISSLGLVMLSEEELKVMIDRIVEANEELVRKRGSSALGSIMGMVMKEARGKARADLVNQLLRRRLEQATRSLKKESE